MGPGRLLGSSEQGRAGGHRDGEAAGTGMGMTVRELSPLQVLITEVFLAICQGVCVGRGTIATRRWFELSDGNSGAFDSPRS